jgi:hypothetical protein
MYAWAYAEDDIHCTICIILVIFISFHGALSLFFLSDSYCLMNELLNFLFKLSF